MNNETPSKQGILFLDSQDASSFEPSSDRSNSRANATAGPSSWSQLSSDSESVPSLVDDSFSSKNTLAGSAKEIIERAVQSTDRKPRHLRIAQYMKNFQVIKEEDSPLLLKNPMASKYLRIDQGRLSLDHVDFIASRRASHVGDDKPATTNKEMGKDPAKKKSKKVSLGSQFRRKSCHCTECGGMSNLEQKTQNIVKAPNRELEKVRMIRQKHQEKNVRKRSAFLNLPNLNKLVMTLNDSLSPRSPGGEGFKRRDAKSSTSIFSKVHPMLTRTLTKEFVPTRRGAETPLRQSRKDSLEPQVVPHSTHANPSHYIIKIFTPADTEEQINENRLKEALKKEEDLVKSIIAAPVLAKKVAKKPKPQRERRDSKMYREVPASPSHSHASHASQSDFGRHSPRANTWRGEGQASFSTASRPKVVIKKYELAQDQQDDYEDEIIIHKKNVEVLDMRTKKEMWGKIGLASPKFKAIFGAKMEERIEEIGEYDDDGNLTVEIKQEPQRASKDIAKKVVSIYNRQVPKFKITAGKNRLFTQTTRTSDSTTLSGNRTNSHPAVIPGRLEELQSNETSPILDEVLATERAKTESLQGLYSIYAAPKMKRSFSKPICLNFQGLHNSKTTELPSITGQNNSSLSSARGHKSTFSLKLGSPNFKAQDTKINLLKGNVGSSTDRPKVTMINKKVSIGLRKITQSTAGQKSIG